MRRQEPTTLAILSGTPMVSRIIGELLRDFGYEIRLLEEDSEEGTEDLLEGVELVLLAPTISDGFRHAFLASMRNAPETANIPVLTLSSALEETLVDNSGFVLWPCRIEELAWRIEAALRAAVADELPVEDSDTLAS